MSTWSAVPPPPKYSHCLTPPNHTNLDPNIRVLRRSLYARKAGFLLQRRPREDPLVPLKVPVEPLLLCPPSEGEPSEGAGQAAEGAVKRQSLP